MRTANTQLLVRCSSMALAATMSFAAQGALAQQIQRGGSFEGSADVVHGSANVVQGTGTTDITVNSASAVIDWTPTDDGPGLADILFQQAGTTATFSGSADFAVLNRILPANLGRRIVLDGNIISQVQGDIGGTVFFYAPGGLLIGSNAVVDVGNLGLTTAEPMVDGMGNFIVNNQVNFQQSISGKSIEIDPGALINAGNEGSYVALFAPRIRQSGTIDVNGQAAFVAAEAGSITFSPDGLFDIEVSIGTDAGGDVIDHEGTTAGPASTGMGDNHRIYMVAVAKNTALTLAIREGSDIGFDVAGAASMDGNTVVLSAGQDIVGGQIDDQSNGNADANIRIDDTPSFLPGAGIAFTSAVDAKAKDFLLMFVRENLTFRGDATLRGAEIVVEVSEGFNSTTIGDLQADQNLSFLAEGPIFGNDSGNLVVQVRDGADLTVAGDLTLSAQATEDFNNDGTADAGSSALFVETSGTVNVGGHLNVEALADSSSGPSGVNADGGSALVSVDGLGSSINVAGTTRLLADAFAASGAAAFGGSSRIQLFAGGVTQTGEISLSSDAHGGDGVIGGNASGGFASILVRDAQSTLSVLAPNFSGDPEKGELDFMSVEAFGGFGFGGNGGNANGGDISLEALFGGTILLPTSSMNPLVIRVNSSGGDTGEDNAFGGNAFGGNAFIQTNSSSSISGGLQIINSVTGGAADTDGQAGVFGVTGGSAVGGFSSLFIDNGGTYVGSSLELLSVVNGGDGSVDGVGGAATGRDVNVTVEGSLSLSGKLDVSLRATGGNGEIGGSAQTGATSSNILTGASVQVADFAIDSLAVGGNGIGGINSFGGNAFSGFVGTTVDGASLDISGDLTISARAKGGDSISNQAGAATAQFSGMSVFNGAQISANRVIASLEAEGGTILGLGAGNGGDATNQRFIFSNGGGQGSINSNLTVITAAMGGNGGESGGNGGNALAEGANLNGANDVTSTDITGDVTLRTTALGGSAPIGLGGTARVERTEIFSVAGDFFIDGNVLIETQTTGGSGQTGGESSGELTRIFVQDADLSVGGSTTIRANFTGGMGSTTGEGGNVLAGPVELFSINGATMLNGDLTVEVLANGGAGSIGGNVQGSTAQASAQNGELTVGGLTTIRTNSTGGTGSSTGDGGTATAGFASLFSINGAAMLNGDLTVESLANGGAGSNGGNVQGSSARVSAENGELTVGGNTTVRTNSTGGMGSSTGDGGTAIAGSADLFFFNGDAMLNGDLTVESLANGGAGRNGGNVQGSSVLATWITGSSTVGGTTRIISDTIGGDALNSDNAGNGGDATSGFVRIDVRNGDSPTAVSLTDVLLSNRAQGGKGGNSTSGGDGGSGGSADGGSLQIFGNAINGTLTVSGTLDAELTNTGGDGGTGVNGGDGGNARGGGIQFGTKSGQVVPDNVDGAATFTDANVDVISTGGNGGDATNGIGGNGGEGRAGSATLLSRGAPVVANSITLTGIGTGGAGGAGDTVGNGGDGIAADLGALLTQAFQNPGRGSSDIGTLNLNAAGVGGAGATDGRSQFGTGSDIIVIQSDVIIDTINVTNSGDSAPDYLVPDGNGGMIPVTPNEAELGLSNATLVSNSITMTTGGEFILVLNDSTVNTGTLDITANSFVLEEALDEDGTVTTTDSLNLTSLMGDIITNTLLVSQGALNLNAAGTIILTELNGGSINATAGEALFIEHLWNANQIQLISPELSFGMNGGLVAGAMGNIILRSTNPLGVVVGDDVADPQDRYVINADTFSKLQAGNVSVLASLIAGGDFALTIGDFEIGGNGSVNTLTFEVPTFGRRASVNPPMGDGILVNGNITADNATSPIALSFVTDLFLLDSSLGSIDLLGNGGSINIFANNIVVADAALFDQLEDDLTAEELAEILNAPAATPRPDGVLNAPVVELTAENAILIQNTGTEELPAGFVSNLDDLFVGSPDNGNTVPDPVLAIINGQVETAGGRVTGDEAATLLIDGTDDPAEFVTGSQVNGCLLTGCSAAAAGAATVDVSSQVQVASDTSSGSGSNSSGDSDSGDSSDSSDASGGTNTGSGGSSGSDGSGGGDVGDVDDGDGQSDFDTDDSSGDDSGGDDSSSEGEAEADSEAETEAEAEEESETEESEDEESEEEESEDEEEEEESEGPAKGPIAPPVSLINTNSLNAPTVVNDPISSSGNPALLDPQTQSPPSEGGE